MKKEIAIQYLKHLENGEIENIIDLFHSEGIVDSPIYGIKKVNVFYNELNNDTSNSKLTLRGIFEENDSKTIALYFTYHWTLKNKEVVTFDVVDIIDFDSNHKILKLKIIYDTVNARQLVNQLKD